MAAPDHPRDKHARHRAILLLIGGLMAVLAFGGAITTLLVPPKRPDISRRAPIHNRVKREPKRRPKTTIARASTPKAKPKPKPKPKPLPVSSESGHQFASPEAARFYWGKKRTILRQSMEMRERQAERLRTSGSVDREGNSVWTTQRDTIEEKRQTDADKLEAVELEIEILMENYAI